MTEVATEPCATRIAGAGLRAAGVLVALVIGAALLGPSLAEALHHAPAADLLGALRRSLLVSAGAVGLGMAVGMLPMPSASLPLSSAGLPALFGALVVVAVARAVLPPEMLDAATPWLLVTGIAFGFAPGFAKTLRGLMRAELDRARIAQARGAGRSARQIERRQILFSATARLRAAAALGMAAALGAEATMSFLGLGAPDARPSLGTLLAQALGAGEGPESVAPAVLLVVVVVAFALLGRAPAGRGSGP